MPSVVDSTSIQIVHPGQLMGGLVEKQRVPSSLQFSIYSSADHSRAAPMHRADAHHLSFAVLIARDPGPAHSDLTPILVGEKIWTLTSRCLSK